MRVFVRWVSGKEAHRERGCSQGKVGKWVFCGVGVEKRGGGEGSLGMGELEEKEEREEREEERKRSERKKKRLKKLSFYSSGYL